MPFRTRSNPGRVTMQRFRRNTWKAILLIATLRFADHAFGLDLVDPSPSFDGQETASCTCFREPLLEAGSLLSRTP